jgi:ketosteroid isomerase-like protein
VIKEVFPVGDRVVARADWGGSGRASGIDLRSSLTSICTIRAGRIVKIEWFFDHAQALEAVGLSERALSQETIELTARQLAEGVSSMNLSLLQAVSDPQIEFTSRFTAVEGRTYRGHAGWADYLADADGAWENLRITVEEVIPAGPERLIAVERIQALARGSGVQFDQPLFVVEEFRDGKALRMRSYLSRKEALEAVGLSGREARADS